MIPNTPISNTTSNLLGLIAILLWSTTIAFSRTLTEQLGMLTAASSIHILAGLVGLIPFLTNYKKNKNLKQFSIKHTVICGILFIIYLPCLYIAIGLSSSRSEVLIIGLINHLWPTFSLIFSLFFFKQRINLFFPVGVLLAIGGIILSSIGKEFALNQLLLEHRSNSVLAYFLAFMAAITWGLYSNFNRYLAKENNHNMVPFFLFFAGLILGICRLFYPEQSHFSLKSGTELAYMAIFPGALAYSFWDISVRKGNITLVTTCSYFAPILSILASTILLNLKTTYTLWIGCVLVIFGAWICKASIKE